MSVVVALCLIPVGTSLVGCGESPAAGPSASATATAPPPKPTTPPASSTPAASASSSPGPTLPGTALKDLFKNIKSIMTIGPGTGPMGMMASNKKDIDALIAAVGTDQKLDKEFGAKCLTTTKLDFQTADGKSAGVLSFCDTDTTYATGRFDGSGATSAQVTIKDAAKFKEVLKKVGTIQ